MYNHGDHERRGSGGRISEAQVEEVRGASDIVEVISSYMPLKKAGKDYKACCPFHAEKTPSFFVVPAKQIFKCFGCGKGGSVFQFVMARDNLTFPEAVRMLAERAGVKIEEPRDRGASSGRDGGLDPSRILKTVAWATRVFEGQLADPLLGRPGREYLERRGFTSETIARFHLGFAPNSWDTLLRAAAKRGVSQELLMAAGLIVPRSEGGGSYDRFRNRVIFPIFDTMNRPIAFGGRTLGDDPAKYLNSPETPVFNKSQNLYGLPAARDAMAKTRQTIVVEGYTDCLMAQQVGIENIVATLGTSLTPQHVRLLKRHVDQVLLIFDGDRAGQNAADRAVQIFLEEELGVRIVTLPDNLDPCDFLLAGRKDEFVKLVAAAPDALEYKWRLVRQQFGEADTVMARRRAVEAMLEALAGRPLWLDGHDKLKQDLMLSRMATVLGVKEESLRERLMELARQRLSRTRYSDEPGAAPSDLRDESSADGDGSGTRAQPAVRDELRETAERMILQVLLASPERIAAVRENLPPEGLRNEIHRRLYEKLLELAGRLQEEGVTLLWSHLTENELSALAADLAEKEVDPEKFDVMLHDALSTLVRLNERTVLQALRAEMTTAQTDEESRVALQKLQDLRKDRHGFLPPGMSRPQGG